MIKYVLKRLLLMIPVLLGVSFIVYGIMSFTPGDPASAIPVSYTHLDVYKRQPLPIRAYSQIIL